MNLWFSWRRKWQPTPVLLPWKSHGWRSLVQSTIHGVTKSRARLNDFTWFSWSFFFNLVYFVIIHLFTHPFIQHSRNISWEKNKHYLIISHVPALVLGAGHKSVSKTDRFTFYQEEKTMHKQNHTLKGMTVTCRSWQAILQAAEHLTKVSDKLLSCSILRFLHIFAGSQFPYYKMERIIIECVSFGSCEFWIIENKVSESALTLHKC